MTQWQHPWEASGLVASTSQLWQFAVMKSSPNYARVRALVAKVLRENHVVRPPILPREIAVNCGLSVKVVEFNEEYKEVAGLMEFTDKCIYVNAADHYNRQTFTIAHELGHFLLHKDDFESHLEEYKVLMRRPMGSETDPVEKEANVFAANLLVPKKFLDYYGKFASPSELADLFAVSRDVIGYRLSYGRPAEAL